MAASTHSVITDKIAACPFCSATKSGNLSVTDVKEKVFWVYCRCCKAAGPEGRTPGEAVLLWNERLIGGSHVR